MWCYDTLLNVLKATEKQAGHCSGVMIQPWNSHIPIRQVTEGLILLTIRIQGLGVLFSCPGTRRKIV